MANKNNRKSWKNNTLLRCGVVGIAALGAAPSWAFKIDTGNPDVNLNWDTTARYSAGWRMEPVNKEFAYHYGYDETETRFEKHDLVTNRWDVLTELDYIYKYAYGFRVSAALWSENAYGDRSHTGDEINQTFGPAAPISNYGSSAEYSSYTERYITGSSGEILDAFVFGSTHLGDTTLSAKLGQHTNFWGESIFTASDGVAYGQAPLDAIKGVSNPGSSAKELFLPTNQLSATFEMTPELSMQGYYSFDWEPVRPASGGTFFGSSDGAGDQMGSDPECAAVAPTLANCAVRHLDAITPDKRGDFGVALRWSPQWMNSGTAGLYYRKFDEKVGWAALQVESLIPAQVLGNRLVYARDTELLGLSYTNTIATFSVGMEASVRKNTALNNVAGYFIGSQGLSSPLDFLTTPGKMLALTDTPDYSQAEGPRGDTFHAVINGVKLLNQTLFWESGDVTFELAYQRLLDVTEHEDIFYSVDYACKDGYVFGQITAGARDESVGCSTKDSLAGSFSFNPKWLEVAPSVDLTLPISLGYGIDGNSPALGGSFEGSYRWSIGLTTTYKTIYEMAVLLSDQHTDYTTTTGDGSRALPGQEVVDLANATGTSGGAQNSHRWLGLRFKTTF